MLKGPAVIAKNSHPTMQALEFYFKPDFNFFLLLTLGCLCLVQSWNAIKKVTPSAGAKLLQFANWNSNEF